MWNLSRFVQNSFEILKWDFDKKVFQENFSENLGKTKASTKIYKILPYFLQFYSGFVLRSKISKKITVISYVVCNKLKRHVHKQITYKEEYQRRFDFKKLILFTLGLGLTTPFSLGLLIWKFHRKFVIVCVEFWLRVEPQIQPTRFEIKFLFITARVERKVRLCVKQLDFFPRWILIRLKWNLSHFVPNSVQILTWNFRKKLFRDNFSDFLWKTKAIL